MCIRDSFFASHPFHLRMEKMSRRISAPVREGALIATKWFYELARGQYRDRQVYLTTAEKKKFQMEFPKDQLLIKTDLAKYELAFRQEPHVVSMGAQKCFIAFAKTIDKDWTPEALEFGDGYFRDAMACALVFRWTDKMIGSAHWYLSDRAFKSQTVAYTLSLLSYLLTQRDAAIDFRKIWNKQEVPDSLKRCIEDLAPRVAQFIRLTPDSVRNVGEYCKMQFCWTRLCEAFGREDSFVIPDDIILDMSALKERKKEDQSVRKIDSGIDAQTRVFEMGGPYWAGVRDFARNQRFGTPTERGVLDVCASIPIKLPTEKQCAIAMKVLATLEQEGFKP